MGLGNTVGGVIRYTGFLRKVRPRNSRIPNPSQNVFRATRFIDAFFARPMKSSTSKLSRLPACGAGRTALAAHHHVECARGVAGVFGLDRKTVRKMPAFSPPPAAARPVIYQYLTISTS